MRKALAWGLCSSLFFACNQKPAEDKTETKADSSAAAQTKTQPVEFADAKYSEIGKKGLASLTSGDIDTWMNGFADNAVWIWNNGDSLVGKPAVTSYWKKRRTEVIDSISFRDDIWLPVKVNQPQGMEQTGIWLLGWYQVSAKYRNGNRAGQYIHTDYHFDGNDKIDRVIQYLDRAVINAALKKK
jgi:hypothetical protein